MNLTDQILDLLADGKWHSFMQVARSLDMQFSDLSSNIQFLSKYGLVEVGDDLTKVRMTGHEYPDLPSAGVRMAWKGKDIANS